jgi:hypothetical protein
MAGIVSAANMGGVADPRFGDDADAIGTTHEHRGSIADSIAPPDPHGHNTIYLDNSITFENYHYWANRSRSFEKHIRTDNVGFAQLGNLLLGRKIKNEQPQLDSSANGSGGTPPEGLADEKKDLSDVHTGANNNQHNGWSHGVTESEWENAQRATRTATWGTHTAHSISCLGPSLTNLPGSIFYLITTDILGPYNVPWAIAVSRRIASHRPQ